MGRAGVSVVVVIKKQTQTGDSHRGADPYILFQIIRLARVKG